jgi:uncharacterized membrane protein
MRFSDPIYLLLLVPALGWIFLVARGMHGMARARRRIALALRTLLLSLLILALAGLQVAKKNRGMTTIFALDRSSSMTSAVTAGDEAFIRKSLEALGPDDRAGLVAFGKNPVVDVNTGSLRALGRVYASPDPSATDLAAAIRLASATFGDGTARRIVVLSDGNETMGDAVQAAQAAATDGIQIDVLPPKTGGHPGAEVVLSEVETPDQVTKGEPFEMRVLADATAATSGVIRVDRDGIPVARVPVNLSKGANSFVVSQKVENPGFYRYRAVLEAEGDTDARNNVGMGFVGVKGRPRILLLEGAPGASEALAQAIRAHDMDVTTGGPDAAPATAEEAQQYDAILLSDFPAEGLSDRQMRIVAAAVRESGIGFGMIGGENSFLPGGYYATPIADALAVDLNVRQRKTFPSSTILIVCDTSGSMGMLEDGVQKVKIAATAAAATVRMMSPNDFVGVAGSTDTIAFVAPIQKAVDKGKIAAQIGTLGVGGGGIYIRPSLEFAYNNLRKQNTRVRHLILLADGNDSDEQGGALELAQKMAAEKMTVSVVAIGGGKDVPFLKTLAAVGRGQFYLADQAKKLQRLFTRDTAIMSRSAIEEGAFLPKMDPGDEALRGLDLRTMPPLYAYDLTGDMPLSRTPMRTGKDDPLLAFRQYGLGTSMAFTSDAQPKWARRWMDWPDFGAFWAQVTRSTLRRASSNSITVTTRRSGGRGLVDVEAYDPNGNPINGLATDVKVLGPDGQAQPVTLEQQGPGRYSGKFDIAATGGYIVSVAEGGKATGSKPRVTRSGLSVAYPPEYQAVRPNTTLLNQLAETTGGQVLTNPVQAFRPSGSPGESIRDLWPFLLLLASLLLPLDIAVRRLALPFAEIWAAALARLPRFRRRAAAPAPQAQAIGQLHLAKRSATPTASEMPERVEVPAAAPPSPKPAPERGPAEPGAAPLSTTQRLLDAKRKRDAGD